MNKLISIYIKYTLMPFTFLSKTHAFLNSKKINIGKSEIRLSFIAYLIIGIVFFNALVSENENNGPCISNKILCSSWTSTYSHGSYNGSEITQDTEIIFYDDSTFTANIFKMDAEGVSKEQTGTWSMECVEKKDNTYKNGEIIDSKISYENQITCTGEAPYYRKTLIYGIYQKTKSKWVLNIAMQHDFLFAGAHGLFNRQSKSPSRLNNNSVNSLNKTSNNKDNTSNVNQTKTSVEEDASIDIIFVSEDNNDAEKIFKKVVRVDSWGTYSGEYYIDCIFGEEQKIKLYISTDEMPSDFSPISLNLDNIEGNLFNVTYIKRKWLLDWGNGELVDGNFLTSCEPYSLN